MRTRHAYSLLPIVLVVAAALAAWQLVEDRTPHPESPVGWVVLLIWLLTCATLVSAVLVGLWQTWKLIRTDKGSNRERAERRRRSAGVAQLVVGGTGLLALVAMGIFAVWA